MISTFLGPVDVDEILEGLGNLEGNHHETLVSRYLGTGRPDCINQNHDDSDDYNYLALVVQVIFPY